MTGKTAKKSAEPAEISGQQSLNKIRWSLRQRLSEYMRRLSSDLFDELDDFLFSSVQPEDLVEGSAQLKLVREFRNKKQLFEEKFLASIDGALQSTLVSKDKDRTTESPTDDGQADNSLYESMEIDLAIERMQRKAFKTYASRIKELGGSKQSPADSDSDPVIPENRDLLIRNSLCALACSHKVFRVSLENRLVFFKLFEKHFLLKMDKLYQDVISIINNKSNREFVDRLFSSSTSIHQRRGSRGNSQLNIPPSADDADADKELLSHGNEIETKVDEVINAWCGDSHPPEFVERMLRETWREVLFLMGLNKGLETREWNEARVVIDLLLSHLANDEQSSMTATEFADLERRLAQGFELAQVEQVEQATFFRMLREHLQAAEQGEQRNNSSTNDGQKTNHAGQTVRSYAAVSDAGKRILDNSDLDDFVALLSDEQEQAAAEVDEEAISMSYYLNMVDTMADEVEANFKNGNGPENCRIRKSTSIDNSYQILDAAGHVLLTRSRIGLAVSLRAGEIRLNGQEDFKSSHASSQLKLADQSDDSRPATTH